MFTLSTSEALQLCEAELNPEEGDRLLPYDDATGRPVVAPVGNLSWGKGFNLMQCGSPDLFDVMRRFLLTKIETQLDAYAWYAALPSGVAAACMDIAYNDGLHGLLHYPQMIAHLAQSPPDYAGAAAQCTTSNPALQSRYKALASRIAAGT